MILTPRQIEIAKLVCSGLTDSEIASRLQVSKRVVRFHYDRVSLALGSLSRAAFGYRFAAWDSSRVKVTGLGCETLPLLEPSQASIPNDDNGFSES